MLKRHHIIFMVGILQFSLPRYIYFVFHGLVKLLYLQLNFKTHTHTHTHGCVVEWTCSLPCRSLGSWLKLHIQPNLCFLISTHDYSKLYTLLLQGSRLSSLTIANKNLCFLERIRKRGTGGCSLGATMCWGIGRRSCSPT